ncbi:hypothetical protein HA052_20820 [Chromobacterium haemolyticum]|uniref:Mu-like prophage FluMu N-terminal domain-containing protein n=1 Tax=Chromobacterium fluminis TaxID=3044269 RepID=A0ABX0LGR8_9NEIS|nr:hypothetical protein [Chromobacterium haemolyticum]NHR07635.1 hypothetical protein [Chromobacterium haemolyticum]
MTLYYAKSTGGFYDDTVHGCKELVIVDPTWRHPTIKAPDPDWALPSDDPDAKAPLINVPDPAAVVPTITVPNPACQIPADAVEIMAEERAALLAAQSAGKVIQADPNGKPVAVDPPPPTPGQTNAAIKVQLAELDSKSIRALHEAVLALASTGTALPADTVKRLQAIEDEKAALRAKMEVTP